MGLRDSLRVSGIVSADSLRSDSLHRGITSAPLGFDSPGETSTLPLVSRYFGCDLIGGMSTSGGPQPC